MAIYGSSGTSKTNWNRTLKNVDCPYCNKPLMELYTWSMLNGPMVGWTCDCKGFNEAAKSIYGKHGSSI